MLTIILNMYPLKWVRLTTKQKKIGNAEGKKTHRTRKNLCQMFVNWIA